MENIDTEDMKDGDNHDTESSDAMVRASQAVNIPVAWLLEADKAKQIDQKSRIVFPLLFLSFNLVYWIYYQVLI